MILLSIAVVTVNIAGGVAALQLNDFGAQTGLQLLFSFEEMKAVHTKAVEGRMDAFVALDRMIEGTPIRYEYVNRRTVALAIREEQSASRVEDGGGLAGELIAEGCSFGLIPSEIAAQKLGEVPQACWCCVSYDNSNTDPIKDAFCVSLPSQNACTAYDSPRKNWWSMATAEDEVVISGAEDQP